MTPPQKAKPDESTSSTASSNASIKTKQQQPLDTDHPHNNDHIGYLVNLGYQLDIRGVTIADNYQSLALYDEHDRTYVTAELIGANRTSVASRYREHVDPVTDVPTVANPKVAFKNLAQFAQALQWVRCYQYQSCDDPNWKTTFAYHYTERLIVELESKIIACFATSWTYDGPGLT